MKHDIDLSTPRRRLGGRRPWRTGMTAACVFGALLTATQAHAVPTDAPVTLDELEIRGEFLAPQALFIVGGDASAAEGAATVLDYLDGWPTEAEPLRVILLLTPPSSWGDGRAAQARPDARRP